MISSAQVQTLPQRTIRRSGSTQATVPSAALPISINPKLAIIGGSTGFIILIIFILMHMGTYNAALTFPLPSLSSHQPDVQPTVVANSTNASAALIRINQTDPSQYQSQDQHDQWDASACSAAAMIEVINAYGHHYRLGNILSVESAIGAISQSQGLLSPDGIDHTAERFGFTTQTLGHPTLQQVLDVANGGRPVVINFPPQPGTIWSGGHFLVLLGGTPDSIHLADSSIVNNGNGLQYVDQSYLNKYWRGFAKIITPMPYSVVSDTPSVSVDFINQVLSTYHSPAQGQGQALYDLGIKYGIDPTFALAFFGHESTLGTKGEATQSLSLGNLRCIGKGYEDLQPSCRDNYAWFPSWRNGFEAFYRLIASDLYVGAGLVTPDQIVPRWAPPSDGNNDQAYIDALKKSVDRTKAGKADIENFN